MKKDGRELGGDEEASIDLSPMIDCIFILLIFFIVTTVFVEEPGVDIIKPFANTAKDLEKNAIILAVTEDNKVIYGGKDIGVGGVNLRVKQLLQDNDYPVIIQGDVNASHRTVSQVWSAVKNAGAKKIHISTLEGS